MPPKERKDDGANMRLAAGVLVDEDGLIAAAVVSEKLVGVSLARLKEIPTSESIQTLVDTGKWLAVWRDRGPQIFVLKKHTSCRAEALDLKTERAQDTSKLALEVAAMSWPDWCPEFRDVIQKRWIIPLSSAAEA